MNMSCRGFRRIAFRALTRPSINIGPSALIKECQFADYKPTCKKRSSKDEEKNIRAGSEGQSSEERRMSCRANRDAEEAEFGTSQGCQSKTYQRNGSHHLHSGYRSQSPGTLCRTHPRRKSQRLAGCTLPRHPRSPRHRRYRESYAEPLQIRRQETEVKIRIGGLNSYAQKRSG